MTGPREPREGFIETGGARLRYLDWEGQEPALFCLHGLSSNARFWSRLAAALVDRRVVALDQRSHGRSDRAPTDLTSEPFVSDGARAIEALRLDPPVVVGHSWGAPIALELAAAWPELCRALAFLDGPAWPLRERLSWNEFAKRAQPALPRYPDLATAVAGQKSYLREAWGNDLVAFVEDGHVWQDGSLVLPLDAPTRATILRAFFGARTDLAWQRLQGPALLGFARRKSELMLSASRAAAAHLAAIRPVTVVWYDSPHDIPLFVPEALAADITQVCLAA